MADAVLNVVQQALQQRSSALLGLPLPSPAVARAATLVEQRTRDVLKTADVLADQRGPWSVARYCEIAGFDVSALVDLLAALEEGNHAHPQRTPRKVRVHRPYVGINNVDHSVEAAAERFVRIWGFTTVEMVASRFRLTLKASDSRLTMTRRALRGLSDLRWLDSEQEWFTLRDRQSRMKAALAKIVAVVGNIDAIDPVDLQMALGKPRSFRDAPRAVVQNFLAELLRGSTRPSWDGDDRGASMPTPEEQVLVAALREQGGTADVQTLRRHTAHWSIGASAIVRTLMSSPLFINAGHGIYRLIGAPLGTGPLVWSERWEATI